MTVYLLLPLIQTLFSLALIVIVLKGHFRSLTHRLFSLFLLSLAIWGVMIFGMRASPDIEHAYSWERWLVTVAPFTSVLFYHFAIRYTATRVKQWLLPFLYTICFLFIPLAAAGLIVSGMQMKPYGYAPVFGLAGLFTVLFTLGVSLMAFLTFVRAYRISAQAEQKNRAAYIITAMIFSFIGVAFDFLPILGLPLYPGYIIGNIVFCSLVTVAIVRYNLLDIRVVFRKGVAYVLTSAVLAVPFIVIFLLATRVFTEGAFPPWAYFIVAIILAFALLHLWQWFQRWVDRWFYRDRYDYLQALESFSRQTQSLTSSAGLGSTMVNLLAKALRSSNVYLLQPLPPSNDFTTASTNGVNNPTPVIHLKNGGALVKWLERSNSILSYKDIETIPQLQAITSKEMETLERIGAELISPLKAPTGQLSGILILGKKLSEQPYNSEDKQLVYTICNQMSTNVENMRLYNESQQEVKERKLAEEALQSEKNKLQSVVDALEDGLSIQDKDYNIIYQTEPTRVTFGGDHVGEKCYRVYEGRDNVCDGCPVEKAFRDGKSHISERKVIEPSAEISFWENTANPIRNARGEIDSCLEIGRNITERKQAEEELQQSREQLRNLSAHIESLREAERTSIAREIHDELGQALTALRMDLSWLNKRLPKGQEELIKKIGEISSYISETIQTVKRISTELRPGVLDDLGLMAAVEWQVQQFQERTRIKCELTAEREDINLDRDQATGIFRILQESLTNVTRHANATKVKVNLKERDGQLVLQVSDNGKGITKKQIAHPKSFGLIGMRERARSLNGSVKVDGISGKGTTVTVSIPLNRKEECDDKNTSRR